MSFRVISLPMWVKTPLYREPLLLFSSDEVPILCTNESVSSLISLVMVLLVFQGILAAYCSIRLLE
jgi:hypothetical protein